MLQWNKQPWFHGDLSMDQVRDLLKGTLLFLFSIRFSTFFYEKVFTFRSFVFFVSINESFCVLKHNKTQYSDHQDSLFFSTDRPPGTFLTTAFSMGLALVVVTVSSNTTPTQESSSLPTKLEFIWLERV